MTGVNKSILEKVFREILDRETRYDDNVIYVTEIVGCIRRSWFRRKYGRDRITKDMLLGLNIHSWILPVVMEKLMYYDLNVEYEKPVSVHFTREGFILAGRVDLAGEDYIIELKVTERTEPTRAWIRQANLYADILDKSRFYIVLVGNGVKVYKYNRDKNLANYLLGLAVEYYKCITEKRIPEIVDRDECKYCEYKHICKREVELYKWLEKL